MLQWILTSPLTGYEEYFNHSINDTVSERQITKSYLPNIELLMFKLSNIKLQNVENYQMLNKRMLNEQMLNKRT
jgi:hypothetical protein